MTDFFDMYCTRHCQSSAALQMIFLMSALLAIDIIVAAPNYSRRFKK